MSYSKSAHLMRECQAMTAAGHHCCAFACWGDTRCTRHGGVKRIRTPTCRCAAYAWPHRPAGGLCRWPDPPTHRLTVAAGTHTRRRRTRFRGLLALLDELGPGMPPHLADHWERRAGD